MTTNVIVILSALILGFSITISFFSFFSKKEPADKVFLPIYLVFSIGILTIYFINPAKYDMLNPISLIDIIAVIIASGAVFLFSANTKLNKYISIPIIIGAILLSAAMPAGFLMFNGHLPFIADRILLTLIIFAFSFCYQYLNGVDGLIAVQTISIPLGIIALFFLGIIPFITSAFSFLLLGASIALVIYTWYPASMRIKSGDCQALGMILAWLLLKISQEGAAACALILIAYFAFEMLWAFGKRILPGVQNKDILANTNYYQANFTGLSHSDVCSSISKIELILIIFACLQIYAPNNFSIPIFSFLITVWFVSRLKNWQAPVKNIREINRDVLADIKDSLNSLKRKDK